MCLDARRHQFEQVVTRRDQTLFVEVENFVARVGGADRLEEIGQCIRGGRGVQFRFAILPGGDDDVLEVDVEFFADDFIADPILWRRRRLGGRGLRPPFDVHRLGGRIGWFGGWWKRWRGSWRRRFGRGQRDRLVLLRERSHLVARGHLDQIVTTQLPPQVAQEQWVGFHHEQGTAIPLAGDARAAHVARWRLL